MERHGRYSLQVAHLFGSQTWLMGLCWSTCCHEYEINTAAAIWTRPKMLSTARQLVFYGSLRNPNEGQWKRGIRYHCRCSADQRAPPNDAQLKMKTPMLSVSLEFLTNQFPSNAFYPGATGRQTSTAFLTMLLLASMVACLHTAKQDQERVTVSLVRGLIQA